MRRLILILVLALVLITGVFAVDFYRYISSPVSLDEDVIMFNVSPGATLGKVTRELHEQDIIQSPLYWKVLARISGNANRIKVGEYRLSSGQTPGDILAVLVAGKTLQYSLTIPEGWTFRQMLEVIWDQPGINKTLGDADFEQIMTKLGDPEGHPEGRFLPETYFYTRGTDDIDILRRSHEALEALLAEEWEARADDLPLKTPYEALILASIVEKETGVADERPMIAAVFINRLRKGMRLQTDPTVIYGMGDAYQGNIRKKDLQRDTPYNTYTRKGLTPTPIALPAASSIHAVLHPADTEALYFVASGGGRHHFSNSYEEHRAAVIKYLLGGNAERYKGDQ